MSITPFWQNKNLDEMTKAEWESLCDGCGHCCLVKLQDEDTDKIYITNVACRLLDIETCTCQDYPNRTKLVSHCLVLAAGNIDSINYLPETCAYRRLAQGLELPQWHPLVMGNKDAVKNSGASICDYAISEEYIHPEQLQEHIINEVDE